VSNIVVHGTALYFRGISQRYPAPAQVVARCKALGLSWAAIGALWQDVPKGESRPRTQWMNSVAKLHMYLDALALAGITPYVWGYPWAGTGMVDEFVAGLIEASGDHKLILIDPEVGLNPLAKDPKTRSQASSPAAMAAARSMASKIVEGLRSAGAKQIGLSTYGGVPRWFPLDAFLRAGVDFAGGQTYTDDTTVQSSENSFLAAFEAAGVPQTQLVPNFGLYKHVMRDGRQIAASKTGPEQAAHLMEFVHCREPIHAVIGWAENFATAANGPEIAKFGPLMERGATALPRTT
jgi:hypothetical protein